MIVDNSQKKEDRIEIFLTGRSWHYDLQIQMVMHRAINGVGSTGRNQDK